MPRVSRKSASRKSRSPRKSASRKSRSPKRSVSRTSKKSASRKSRSPRKSASRKSRSPRKSASKKSASIKSRIPKRSVSRVSKKISSSRKSRSPKRSASKKSASRKSRIPKRSVSRASKKISSSRKSRSPKRSASKKSASRKSRSPKRSASKISSSRKSRSPKRSASKISSSRKSRKACDILKIIGDDDILDILKKIRDSEISESELKKVLNDVVGYYPSLDNNFEVYGMDKIVKLLIKKGAKVEFETLINCANKNIINILLSHFHNYNTSDIEKLIEIYIKNQMITEDQYHNLSDGAADYETAILDCLKKLVRWVKKEKIPVSDELMKKAKSFFNYDGWGNPGDVKKKYDSWGNIKEDEDEEYEDKE